MFARRNAARLAKVVSRRRVRDDMFDNWYVHCPKCGSLMVSLMGKTGPEYFCYCGSFAAKRPDGVRSQRSEVRSQRSEIESM